jgi:hypothetical protein
MDRSIIATAARRFLPFGALGESFFADTLCKDRAFFPMKCSGSNLRKQVSGLAR